MGNEVLEGYILRLKHKDRVLGETFEFVINQLNQIQEVQAQLLEAQHLVSGGSEDLTLYRDNNVDPMLGITDRSVWTHSELTVDQLQFQIGAKFYNRIDPGSGPFFIAGIIPVTNGQRAIIVNIGLKALVLKHEDATAFASYRLLNVGFADITLNENDMALIWRDEASDRWRGAQL